MPQWDGQHLGVTGSSQGGFLSLAVAALDKRVSFFGAVHDAMCDYESELKGVAGGWPHYFYQVKNPSEARIKGARYYDGVLQRCDLLQFGADLRAIDKYHGVAFLYLVTLFYEKGFDTSRYLA